MSRHSRVIGEALLLLLGVRMHAAQQPPNQVASSIQEFEKRLQEYQKLRKTAKSELPRLKPTNSPEVITHHEHRLAHDIRKARSQARQGEIFTPEVSEEFRKLIAAAMQGPQKARIKESLGSAEPATRHPLRVNETYPSNIPLQSTPPTLLLNLPTLPPELDYRVISHDLVLRDIEANLIVDFIPNAVP